MSAWLKPAAAALAALIAFGAGCRYSAAQADAEISALKEDYATRARALEEKYRESEALANAKLRAAWEERDIALAHASDPCLLTLSGCASNPTPPAVDCPQPPQVPASLARSSLPEVQALSSEAQSYFKDVSDFLRELQSTRTP